MNIDEFLSNASQYGSCVGLHAQPPVLVSTPSNVELRTLDGARTKTVNALFDVFAEVWHFPPWFGRNSYAFDDFMRDLETTVSTATGKPPARGYLTDITNAQLLLVNEPEALYWFGNKISFYRDFYRDDASPPAAFGLLLSAPSDRLDEIRQRWLSAGIPVVDITVCRNTGSSG